MKFDKTTSVTLPAAVCPVKAMVRNTFENLSYISC